MTSRRSAIFYNQALKYFLSLVAQSMILICDACDKGYHGKCHDPVVTENRSADQTVPWICSSCQVLGYHIKSSTEEVIPVSTPGSADSGVSSLTAVSTSKPNALSVSDDTSSKINVNVEKAISSEMTL